MKTVRETVFGDLADKLEKRAVMRIGEVELIDPPLLLAAQRDALVDLLREATQLDSAAWQPISTYKNGNVVQVWAAHSDGTPFLSFTVCGTHKSLRPFDWCAIRVR